MKNGKRPNREQRKRIEREIGTADGWYVCKDTSTEIVIINQSTGETKTVDKA